MASLRVGLRTVAACAAVTLLAACGSAETTSAESSSASSPTTTTTSAAPTMTPAPPPAGKPVPFRDYLSSIGVTGMPAHFDETPGLEVTVPIPDGWARTSDPLFATGIEYVQPLGDKASNPTTTLMAIELDGDFDPKDAISHANTDALPPNATGITESYDDYDGFPSAAAEGTVGDTEHYSRIVLATVPSSGKRYLVQLSTSAPVSQPIAQNPALNTVVSGLKVTAT